MELFAKGKRALIYKEKNTIIKVERQDSTAVNRMHNEAEWLTILNKHKIGPKIIKLEHNKLSMEYIPGPNLEKYLSKATKKEKVRMLTQLLDQARTLDKLQVNKMEMHRVTKNAIVKKNKLILLDFERCKRSPSPKNVTQACQFINKYLPLPQLLAKAKAYKQTFSEKDYKVLRKCLTNTL